MFPTVWKPAHEAIFQARWHEQGYLQPQLAFPYVAENDARAAHNLIGRDENCPSGTHESCWCFGAYYLRAKPKIGAE